MSSENSLYCPLNIEDAPATLTNEFLLLRKYVCFESSEGLRLVDLNLKEPLLIGILSLYTIGWLLSIGKFCSAKACLEDFLLYPLTMVMNTFYYLD